MVRGQEVPFVSQKILTGSKATDESLKLINPYRELKAVTNFNSANIMLNTSLRNCCEQSRQRLLEIYSVLICHPVFQASVEMA